jgi:hypothetical protein
MARICQKDSRDAMFDVTVHNPGHGNLQGRPDNEHTGLTCCFSTECRRSSGDTWQIGACGYSTFVGGARKISD